MVAPICACFQNRIFSAFIWHADVLLSIEFLSAICSLSELLSEYRCTRDQISTKIFFEYFIRPLLSRYTRNLLTQQIASVNIPLMYLVFHDIPMCYP